MFRLLFMVNKTCGFAPPTSFSGITQTIRHNYSSKAYFQVNRCNNLVNSRKLLQQKFAGASGHLFRSFFLP
jgi:hypothetical protein